MPDLKDPRLMYLKAVLFLVIGLLACVGILLEMPSLRIALLLAAAIWAFCRLYYFLFYVIERYIDPEARFAGVGDAVKYVVRRRAARRARRTTIAAGSTR
jgi:hypothetical protein